MSWQAVSAGRGVFAGVRISITGRAKPMLRIGLGPDVLKAARLAAGDRLRVLMGAAEHAGLLRLEPAGSGGGPVAGSFKLQATSRATGAYLNFRWQPGGGPDRLKSTSCAWRLDGGSVAGREAAGALIVTLPAALKPAPVAQAVSGPVTFDDAALKRKARGGGR